MKKILSLVLSFCLLIGVSLSFSGCTPREEKLIIRNWGYYMSKEVYKGFESWYKEKTGQNVKVEYNTYDINETMYKKVLQGSDYDLVCPSDYMVERMVREGLLQKLSKETQEVLMQKIDPDVLEFARAFDANLEYSMPYLWGTLGIMYNSLHDGQDDEVMSSWAALFDGSFGKKVYMKDSPRDAYTVAMLYDNSQALIEALENGGAESQEYQDLLDSIFNHTSLEKIAKAKEILQKQKKDGLILGYDVDFAKEDMLLDYDGSKGSFGVFWSCDAGYVMNGEEDESPNKNLRYIVPKEGSNVWVDAFVIPKNAKNTHAANLFIQYLCEKDIAYNCMEYAGATSAVLEAVEKYREDLENDENGFFASAPQGFRQMYMDMMFPSKEILSRCGIMKDFNAFNDDLINMWQDVKSTR